MIFNQAQIFHFKTIILKLETEFKKENIDLKEYINSFIEQYEGLKEPKNVFLGVPLYDKIFKITTGMNKDSTCPACVNNYIKNLTNFYNYVKSEHYESN